MQLKKQWKYKAIELRKKGLSYREILQQVPVAKSTLSLWLRSVGLSKSQKQRLTKKRLEASRRGGEARKAQRIAIVEEIRAKAVRNIKTISKKELWLMGVILYWAEGSKKKEHGIAQPLKFGNLDPNMIRLYLK